MDRLIVRNPLMRRVVAFTPLFLIVVLGLTCLVAYLELRRSRLAAGNAREARLAAEEVISDLKDAETGQRGFLLLGDESYLQPYEQGMRELRADTARLRMRASKSAAQQLRLRLLGEQIRDRLAIIDSTIALRRAGNRRLAEEIVRAGHGRLHMNAIRGIIAEMDAEESDSLAVQLAGERRSAILLLIVFVFGFAVVAPIAWLINRAMLRFVEEREQWLHEATAHNALLQEQSIELETQRDHLQEQAVELEAQQNELEMQNEELQVANEALEQARVDAETANAAKSAFLTSMSHELRTPLNAIAGYTDLIEAGVYGAVSGQLLDAIQRIHINETQLLSVINQILDYTGLKSQTQAIPLQPIEVFSVLDAVEAIVAPLVREKGLDYSVTRETAQTLYVLGNADRIRQVLVNLLANAVKFTPAPGSITVSCRQANEQVQISVRDTGIGIDPAQLDRIFEPFVQLSDGTSAPTNGVGLGLAISRELVHGMGGELSVVSQRGAGSVFTVSLQPVGVSAPPAPREISASRS